MNKSCDNCYYKLSVETRTRIQDIQNYGDMYHLKCALQNEICKNHTFGCSGCYDERNEFYHEEGTFKYNSKLYCEKCCAEAVGIELRPYTAYQYYDTHGDFLGDSETIELQDILLNCSVVEYIGDDD